MKWFAVIVELKSSFARGMGVNPNTGNHLKIDIEHKNKIYSVVFKAGSALKVLASEKADLWGGKMVEVNSEDMFNVSDINLDLLA